MRAVAVFLLGAVIGWLIVPRRELVPEPQWHVTDDGWTLMRVVPDLAGAMVPSRDAEGRPTYTWTWERAE